MKNDDQDVCGLKCFLLIFLTFNLASAFTFQCPSPYQWNIRAESQCPITDGYICLFDENENNYREICRRKNYYDPAGYKLVIAGNLDRRICESSKYQPFKFYTNGSSFCIFEKTYCNDEGQIIFHNGSTESDRQCRCDYTRGYDFITKPEHWCYCIPSMEDCSCYKKPCPPGSIVSPDYQCINLTSWNSQFSCELILPFMPKDTTTFPSNDNTLVDSKIAQERIKRIVISIMIGVTIIFTLIIAKKNVLTENVGLNYNILAGQAIPKNIRDLQEYDKTQWKERFSNFVETRAFKAVIEKIKEEQCILISGPFGCGKSSLAFHIALKLEEALEYDFMIITNPDDLLRYASEDKKQVFLIDDVFGKYSLSEYDTMWWNRQGGSFQHLLTRNANLRLLMTTRLHIYKYLSEKVIQLKVNVCHINLISEHLVLTYEEKPGSNYDFKTENDIQYFTIPLECVKTEIENIRKSPDLFYLALGVLVLFNNSVHKDVFTQNYQKYDEMLKFVSKELGYGKKIQKQFLLLHVIALTGSYVTETESSFECLNDNLFNVLAFCIGPSIMHSILRYGTMSFINERMNLESASERYPKITIMIQNSHHDTYFERVLEEMKTGLYDIFIRNHHELAKHSDSFITYMKNNLKKGVLKNSIESNATVLHVVSAEGYAEYVDFFLRLDKNMLNQQDDLGQTALHKASVNGHINISKLLLDNGAYIEIRDNNSNTALDIACTSGVSKSSMVEFLLSRKAKICPKATDARTALHVACENNKFEVAELLLKYRANVNQQDYYKYTPLHLACKNRHINIAELLIKHKPKLDLCDNKGRTALYFAVQGNDISVVESLLKLKANTNIPTDEGRVPLFCACEQGSFEVAEMLIKHGAIVDYDDKQSCKPLYIACKNGHFKVAQLLLLNKADPNKYNEFRNTSIFIACDRNYIEVVRILLGEKVDVNRKNKSKLAPLHVACNNNNKNIVSLLIKHGALVDEPDTNLETALFHACSKCYNSIVAELLRHHASMTKTNRNGQTPLHIACKVKSEETVKLLLNAGTCMNESDKERITPLRLACDNETDKIVKLLLNAGVDVSKSNLNGSTVLDMALENERKEVVTLLLKANVNVNTGEKECIPSLLSACSEGNESVVEVLLDSVAYVNGVDKDGMTPLLMACKGGKENIVTMLINSGADVNKGNTNGITPLQMACNEGKEAIVKVLLNSVAIVNKSDINGMTPLHAACKIGNNNLVSLLLKAGANVNKCDKNGIKPLHIAYKVGNEEIDNGGLNLGAEGDTVGFMILGNTCRGGIKEIVRLLLDAGANVNKDDKYDVIPVQVTYPNEKKSIRDLFFS